MRPVLVLLFGLLGSVVAGDSLNVRLVGSWPYGPALSVALDPGRRLAFLGAGAVVRILDITDPASPTPVSDAVRPQGVVVALVWDVNARRLYLSASGASLEIWDVASASDPRFLGRCSASGDGRNVAFAGQYAYVVDSDTGLRVVNVADPSHPALVGSWLLASERVRGLAVSGQFAYAACDDAGRAVIDISDPYNLRLTALPQNIGSARGVAVSGQYAYVAAYGSGLRIVDVSDPANPHEVGSYRSFQAREVAVVGSKAYVASLNGLHVFDVSTPQTPQLVGLYYSPGSPQDVAVLGNQAFLPTGLLVYGS